MQEFKLDKKYIFLVRAYLVIFLMVFVLAISIPFLPDGGTGEPDDYLLVSATGSILFGCLTVFTWIILKRLPFTDVAADEHGIWYVHIGKHDGLVPWDSIYRIKERAFMQRLDLIGVNNKKLLSVEYQLQGFEELRAAINDMPLNRTTESGQREFSKGLPYHLLYLLCLLGSATFGLYVAGLGYPLLGYGAMSFLLSLMAYEYLFTATGVTITNERISVAYPFTTRNIDHADIEEVLVADQFYKGLRLPEVWIMTRNARRPFKLGQLGADANTVYQALQQALNHD